ncbi:MAG: FHA domain-containing protein [Pseudomonadota bacterium]|nr:FHA domain-containing protein [Pseudomonadota bacterium]
MSLFERLRQWLFPTADAVDALPSGQHRCPAGHWLDPSWTECPRCKAESQAALGARVRRTVIETPADEAAPAPAALRGILVTFSWEPGGELFVLREGNTEIGAVGSAAAASADHAISIAQDDKLSRRHARIRCHGDQVLLSDLGSSNGTFVDGVRVGPDGVWLGAQARFSTGRTLWQFQRIEHVPAATERQHVHERQQEHQHEHEPQDKREKKRVDPQADAQQQGHEAANDTPPTGHGEAAHRQPKRPTIFEDEPAPPAPTEPGKPPRERGTRFE